MFNAILTASNVSRIADKIEFAHALLGTVDLQKQAQGVATYNRIAERANAVTARLSVADAETLTSMARLEVAERRYLRREKAQHMKARRDELAAMRADLEL